MRKINKICQTSIIGLLFAFGFVTNSFALNCPTVPPATTLGTVNYDPNSTNDTVVDFAATIPAANTSQRSNWRYIYLYKQVSEDEGLDYTFTPISGGNLNNGSSSTFNTSLPTGTWRNFPYELDYKYGYLGPTIGGTASFRLNIRKGQSNLTSKFIEYYVEGDWGDLSKSLYNNIPPCPLLSLNGTRIGGMTSFYLNIPTSTAISMAGGGTSGDIKFNTGNGLKTGEKKSITINVKSNQKYKVSFDSAYNGYLNLDNNLGATEKVPYTMTFAGQTVSDSAAFEDTTATGTGGNDAPKTLEVTIGNTDNARAGWYKDVVTLTITNPL